MCAHTVPHVYPCSPPMCPHSAFPCVPTPCLPMCPCSVPRKGAHAVSPTGIHTLHSPHGRPHCAPQCASMLCTPTCAHALPPVCPALPPTCAHTLALPSPSLSVGKTENTRGFPGRRPSSQAGTRTGGAAWSSAQLLIHSAFFSWAARAPFALHTTGVSSLALVPQETKCTDWGSYNRRPEIQGQGVTGLVPAGQ